MMHLVKTDPFLSSVLQRFMCELYYRFGLFLAPLSIRLIMSRHYLLDQSTKNGRTSCDDGQMASE